MEGEYIIIYSVIIYEIFKGGTLNGKEQHCRFF